MGAECWMGGGRLHTFVAAESPTAILHVRSALAHTYCTRHQCMISHVTRQLCRWLNSKGASCWVIGLCVCAAQLDEGTDEAPDGGEDSGGVADNEELIYALLTGDLTLPLADRVPLPEVVSQWITMLSEAGVLQLMHLTKERTLLG